MNPIISVENLSKAYRIGAKEDVPDTIVGAAKGMLKAPFKNLARLRSLDTSASSRKESGSDSDILWALRDVSFEINQGDVVGIIGRNGAGKSTLLKVLSRITEPTSGRVVIRGRVSSLLEVGTGFHPELTGRENIYMNGTILGMTKREIDRKFDEIVDFSGVEKFLDTPTKRYSSGMQVRLAFAVAAHLEPEILVVDEVLAVGDVGFQQRCMNKMNEVSSTGRTVLFVSHNVAAIGQLCQRGLLLSDGSKVLDGEVHDAVEKYREMTLNLATSRPSETCSGIVRDFQIANQEGGSEVYCGKELCITFAADLSDYVAKPRVGIGFDDLLGSRVLTIHSLFKEQGGLARGRHRIHCRIPFFPLAPGRYKLKLTFGDGKNILESHGDLSMLSVQEDLSPSRELSFHNGLCVARSSWSTESSV